MEISNDTLARTKIAVLYVGGFLMMNFVATAFLHFQVGIAIVFILPVCGCTAPLFYRFFKNRARSLATDVFLHEDLLSCTVDGAPLRLPKNKISAVDDTGFNSAPHLIVVSLKNGRNLEFFPSRNFGLFHAGRLKKTLREWLTSPVSQR